MLSELKVANFAIIDKVNVQFKSGFNVLSGETGSGKSILLKSLALLMGEKSVSDTIKTGSEQATVEGSFDLVKRNDIKTRLIETGLSDASKLSDVDDTLVVKRVISHDGKNRVYINGSLSTLQQLRDIVAPLIEVTGHPAPLIEMTGQHENRNLQSKAFHLEALDQYIGASGLRKNIEELFTAREKVVTELRELEESARTKSQRLDFLTYQRDEIKALGLKPGEEESLESELKLLKNSTRLTEFIDGAETALYSDDDSALVRIHRILQKAAEIPALKEKTEPLLQAKTLIEECVYGLRDYGQKFNNDPAHREALEEKLSGLRKLQKKYGVGGVATVADIMAELEKIEAELSTLENSETRIEGLRAEVAEIAKSLQKKSLELHKQRVGGAETLAKSVNAELEELNMKGLLFSVRVEKLLESRTVEGAPRVSSDQVLCTSTGCSEVEFMIQSSKKDAPRALAKFASGGELSRILLSLKRVVGVSEYPRTYLFDEVDAGVSGVTAEKVGRKLKAIAKGQQVICVTHLPQVAAFANAHYVINKSQVSSGVRMTVEELGRDAQVKEIARMLSGEKITKSSIEHAKELLGG